MVKPLTQAALAQALGVAPSRVTKMKSEGMPTHSIEAAREWRARVRFYMKPTGAAAAPPEPSDYLDGLDDGWLAAYSALRDFVSVQGLERFGVVLAAITDSMPLQALMHVSADPVIDDRWDELQAEFERMVAGAAKGSEA